jgi:hypothetical protein
VGSIQGEEELVKRGVFHSGNKELYSNPSSFSTKGGFLDSSDKERIVYQLETDAK